MFRSLAACLLAAVSFASLELLSAQNSDAPSCEEVEEWCRLMTKYGRDWEGYHVLTDDQWELTLFRILPGANAQVDQTGRDVLFMHDFLQDATSWLMGANPNDEQEKGADIA